MKQYPRETILQIPNNKAFKIIRGTVTKRINNKIITSHKDNEILLNITPLYTYQTEQITTGIFLELDSTLLNNYILKQTIQIELLLINDPIIKFTRYLYYKYLEKQVLCFYLEIKIKDLANNLKIEKRQLSTIITYLEKENIITKNNKLFIINNLQKLIELAYKKDY